MLSFIKKEPPALALQIANRFRDQRLALGWSRAELGARSGVAVPTLRKFEDTGQISLNRLLQLASILGISDEFERIAAPPLPIRSLADIEATLRPQRRHRGRTIHKE